MAKSTALISNPKFRRKLASYLAAGVAQHEIAKKLKCSDGAISQSKRHPDMRQAIEAANAAYLAEALDPTVYALSDIIKSYPDYKAAGDKEGLALSLKYADKLAQAVGIAATHTPSQLVVNLLQVQPAELSPAVKRLLDLAADRYAGRLIDIDAEVTSDAYPALTRDDSPNGDANNNE